VGELRFAPPQPFAGAELLDTTHYKPNCMQPVYQGEGLWPGLNGTVSEDCLYLSVFAPTPRVAAGRQLPVLFYVFGGGDYAGGAADMQLDGLQSVATTLDAVVGARVPPSSALLPSA
jgi:para-nitrobenzyl esterase